ncbi:hypothetical protein [Caldisericum sp.]|uniref:hypothetical protein n=1 Tax=Caldisericum sp. TaxID=2499687 RepID=UPI003D0B356E
MKEKIITRFDEKLNNYTNFNNSIENTLQRVKNILTYKNKEYCPTQVDPLQNFARASEILNVPLLDIWRGYWLKHIVSLLEIIENPSAFSVDVVKEKVQDIIAYMCIFEYMFNLIKEVNNGK